MLDRSDRAHVAWDIETTGFGWADEITTSGFWFPGGHATVIVNNGPHTTDSDALENSLNNGNTANTRVRTVDDEPGLLSEMQRVLFDRFDKDYDKLIAYNADSWKGGFDLPFTRTRCIRHGIDWVFNDVLFTDLWEPVVKRLNTTHAEYGTSVDVNTLTGAYGILLGQNHRASTLLDEHEDHVWYHKSPYDPFDDSKSAVTHYHSGELLSVCEHNLADIHRTWELGELVRTFVSPKDITEKKL